MASAALVGCGGDDETLPRRTATQRAEPTTTVDTGTSAPAASPAVPAGGQITAVQPEGDDLNPHTGIGGSDHTFLWLLHDNLVSYDQKGIPTPDLSLAESWEVNDQTELTFHLRKGVTFHDGEPVNSEAIRYNIELVQDPDTGSVARGQILPITEIETPDDFTVKFRLDKPAASLITLLGDRGGMVVSPRRMEALGLKGYAVEPTGGSGPFQFVEWVRNDHLTVSKRKGYWRQGEQGGALPYLDEIRFRFLLEPTVQVAALETGEVHTSPISPENLRRVEANPGLSVATFAGAATDNAFFNLGLAPMDDVRFRQALAYALDREALSLALTDGTGPAAKGFLTPAQWAYDEDLDAPSFDLDRAQKLFSASGNAEGVVIRGITYSRDIARRTAELWQRMVQKIGVDLQMEFYEPGAAFAEYKKGNHHLFFSGFSIRADPHGSIYEVFHKDGGFAWTRGGADLPEVDSLLDQANEVYDIDERKSLYSDAQRLIATEHAMATHHFYNVKQQAISTDIGNSEKVFGGEGKQRFVELYIKQ